MPRFGYVSLVGRPNAGKSTLMNRLMGTKIAIVSDKPQTTRNRILGVQNYDGRGQVVYLDTPGIHRPQHRMNVRMLDAARRRACGTSTSSGSSWTSPRRQVEVMRSRST